MGDEVQSGPAGMRDVYRQWQARFPEVAAAVQAQLAPAAQAQLGADVAVAPGYSKLAVDTAKAQLPALAEVGRGISADEARRAAETELDIMRGPGRGMVEEARAGQEVLDPEYYATRERLSNDLAKYFSGLDPNKLSGSEREEVSRSIARSGFKNPQSAQDTVANAMTFGKELQNKQDRFSAALANASQILGTMQSGLNAPAIAANRQVAPNIGVQAFMAPKTDTGQYVTGLGQSMFDVNSALQQAAMAKQKSTMEKVGEGFGIIGNLVSKVRKGE